MNIANARSMQSRDLSSSSELDMEKKKKKTQTRKTEENYGTQNKSRNVCNYPKQMCNKYTKRLTNAMHNCHRQFFKEKPELIQNQPDTNILPTQTSPTSFNIRKTS
jgi:hypothetical protein